MEIFSDLPIPSLKHLIPTLLRRLDTLSDGGDDRKASVAQSLGSYLMKDENASKDTLMECIQDLFSEYAQAKGGDDQDGAGQFSTTARAPKRDRRCASTARAPKRDTDDTSPGSTGRKRRARVSVKQKQI
jgi:hypothetical protein